jgi:hypothetical protein
MKNRNKEVSKASSNCSSQTSVVSLGSGTASVSAVSLTHDRVAERAKVLCLASGCTPGRDEQNWHEAEAQLKAELKSC